MFKKLRSERDAYQIAFGARLGSAETILTAIVEIQRAVLDTWVATSDVITTNPTVIENGRTVQITLDTAPVSVGSQPAGRYRIMCEINTNAGRVLENYVDLRVSQ
jgi:hypothetical protein